MRLIFSLVCGMLVLCSFPSGYGAPLLKVSSAMFADEGFHEEKYTFSPYEKIYIVLDFHDISPGKYNMTADWITPWGKMERQTPYVFALERSAASHRVFFWLKLKRRGRLKQILRGSDFKEEFFGEWTVQIYVNGRKVATRKFRVV